MENQKELYEKAVADSQLKQEIMKAGIQAIMESRKYDLEYIQRCFKVLQDEESHGNFAQKTLNEIVSGEFEKRERARETLGLNKVN